MTTPQPNQLPEEVSERIVTAIEGRFRDWLMNGEHEEARQLVCEILTPYLAPRPPAPVDAEWAKQRIKELELCLHGLLGLEGKDTSAPKLKCYFDSARQLLTNIK